MMHRTIAGLAGVLALAASCGGAAAQTRPGEAITGNTLLNACAAEVAIPDGTPAARTGNVECRSYLMGFFESVRYLNQESDMRSPGQPPGLYPAGCMKLPDYVSFRDLAKIVTDYGLAHPDLRTGPAVQLVKAALADKYPCPEKPPG
jgi:hypothetical protein